MGFGEAVKTCFGKKYADFRGRASRSEYWYFFLALILGAIAFALIWVLLFGNSHMSILILDIVIALAILLPVLAAQVRRAHDTNASGWWVLLAFIPYIGHLILLVWCCFKGTAGPNRFGPDPLNPDTVEAFD